MSPNGVLAIVCAGICLAQLDLFIVNVALPDMARGFGNASLDDMSWILNAYAITYAALLMFFGRFVERHRRDTSFLWGIGLFTAASAACGMAGSLTALVLFRVVQAAGAALMTPTSLGLLLAAFPAERRGAAVRTWTALGGFAAALGPLLGGLLVTVSWRWIFIVNVPLGLVAIAYGYWKLPVIPGHEAPKPSPWAAILVTAGIAALVFAIVKGNDWGWTSPGVLTSFGVALGCLIVFVKHCIDSDTPFIEPALFRIRPFTGAVLVLAPFSVAFGALLLSVALWEQSAWNWSALQTGLAIMPGPALVPVTSLLLGSRLIKRFGPAAVITGGIGAFVASFLVLALGVGSTPSAAIIVAGMIPAGIGVGLAVPTLMAVGSAALPASSFATGSGMINMIRQAAIAIGVAVFVAVIHTANTPAARLAAFHAGWWTMAAVTALGLIPLALLVRAHRPALPQSMVQPQRG